MIHTSRQENAVFDFAFIHVSGSSSRANTSASVTTLDIRLLLLVVTHCLPTFAAVCSLS